jgi:Secretion system C-terminal sorting domain
MDIFLFFTYMTLPDTINNMNFSPSMIVDHYYSWFPIQGEPGGAVNYISEVWMNGYYKKGKDSVSAEQLPSPANNMNHYSFNCALDSNFMKYGYDFYYKIFATDRGVFPHTSELDSMWRRVIYKNLVSSINENIQIISFNLNQNYPNPFNPTTIISYSIPSASNVKLIVYNTLGQTVKVLETGFKQAGNYSVNFTASDLPSGIYFYKLEAGQFSQIKKMILIK